jgi:hypothetical protein
MIIMYSKPVCSLTARMVSVSIVCSNFKLRCRDFGGGRWEIIEEEVTRRSSK